VRSQTPALGLGPTAFDLGGEVRWIAGDLEVQTLRQAATQAGGHAGLFKATQAVPTPADGVFHPMPAASRAIVARLKQEFDPKCIFNPGRLVAGI